MSTKVGTCEVHVPGRDQPSEWCAACRMTTLRRCSCGDHPTPTPSHATDTQAKEDT